MPKLQGIPKALADHALSHARPLDFLTESFRLSRSDSVGQPAFRRRTRAMPAGARHLCRFNRRTKRCAPIAGAL